MERDEIRVLRGDCTRWRTVSWGTPHKQAREEEKSHFRRNVRDDKYDLNQLKIDPWIPNQEDRRVIMIDGIKCSRKVDKTETWQFLWANVIYEMTVNVQQSHLPRWLRWLRHSAHRPGRSVGEAGAQFPGRPVDFVFGFQGRMLWDYFFGSQRGFVGVLYNLWPLANIELSDAQ